jgi:hypothetical protein
MNNFRHHCRYQRRFAPIYSHRVGTVAAEIEYAAQRRFIPQYACLACSVTRSGHLGVTWIKAPGLAFSSIHSESSALVPRRGCGGPHPTAHGFRAAMTVKDDAVDRLALRAGKSISAHHLRGLGGFGVTGWIDQEEWRRRSCRSWDYLGRVCRPASSVGSSCPRAGPDPGRGEPLAGRQL